MNWAIGILGFFCGAVATGIFVGNHQNTVVPVNKELAKVEQVYTGDIGPESTAVSSNVKVDVKRLLTFDGCKVYRFYDDGNYHYFSNCTGATDGTF